MPRTALLLTAAAVEAKSVYQGLAAAGIELAAVQIAGHECDQGTVKSRNGEPWRIVLVQPVEKGPHSMQSAVKDMLSELRPDMLLMIGMCGGIEENGANEDAVVIAKQVFNYEPRRLRPDGPHLTPSTYRCDPRILECVNALERRGALDPIAATGEPAIKLLMKAVGSGEKLVDDLNSSERALIVGLSDDLVGVEQEGHALYHSLWEELLRGAPPPYALIKGVSDLVDGSMRTDKLERQRRATLRALAVGLAIVQNYS